MKNINIQTLREIVKEQQYDVQFYVDYWTYLPEDEEFQTDRENEIEYQSNLKNDMDDLPDDVEQHDGFAINLDEWPQLFDESLNITISDYNYDQECMTLECVASASDGTYVYCYLNFEVSTTNLLNRKAPEPVDEETIIKEMLKDYPDELKKFSF